MPKLTKAAKRKILGLNSARLYRLPSASEPSSQGVYNIAHGTSPPER
jgi:hypothetical protein